MLVNINFLPSRGVAHRISESLLTRFTAALHWDFGNYNFKLWSLNFSIAQRSACVPNWGKSSSTHWAIKLSIYALDWHQAHMFMSLTLSVRLRMCVCWQNTPGLQIHHSGEILGLLPQKKPGQGLYQLAKMFPLQLPDIVRPAIWKLLMGKLQCQCWNNILCSPSCFS